MPLADAPAFDWLNGILATLIAVAIPLGIAIGKLLAARAARKLRATGHDTSAAMLEAVLSGIQAAGDAPTKTAVLEATVKAVEKVASDETKAEIQKAAERTGVQGQLDAKVQQLTNGEKP